MFSRPPIWNHGWCTTLASNVLLSVVETGQSVHQVYPPRWISAGNHYNIAVLTGDGEAASYIYSPFDERPFSVPLPLIGQHRLARSPPCVVPFADGETIESDYAKGPRWIMATEDFSNRVGPLQTWRERVKALEIQNPDINLTRAYVGCSYCGFGSWVGLPSRSSELCVELGTPFIRFRWP